MANPNRDRTPDPADAFEIATGDVDLHDLVTQYMQETVIARSGSGAPRASGTQQATVARFASRPSTSSEPSSLARGSSSAPERTEVVPPPAPPDDEPSGLDETQPLEPVRLPPESEESIGAGATNVDDGSGTVARPGIGSRGTPATSGAGGAFEEATSPGLLPVPSTGANAAAGEKRGDVKQLLASIGPFLWSLENAERWVRAHGAGDVEAESYARALGLLARVLSQLQARVDEVSAAVPDKR